MLHPFAALPTAVYWPTDAIAAGLLPPSLHDALGLRWGTAESVHGNAALATGTSETVDAHPAVAPHLVASCDRLPGAGLVKRSRYP